MIKVTRIGEHRFVRNPANGQETEMVHVTFQEAGRKGANPSLANSSDFLSRALAVEAGLEQVRTHSQLVSLEAAAKLREGMDIPGHINRKLYSTAQMAQQEDVAPRMIDGRPTYFATELGDTAEEDVDLRLSNEALVNAQGTLLFSSKVGATEVRVIRSQSVTSADVQESINRDIR